MPFLIDSDCLIDLFTAVPGATDYVEALSESGLVASIVGYMETWVVPTSDVHGDQRQRKRDALFAEVLVIDLTRPVAQRCAELRASLGRTHRAYRRALDLVVAATALEFDLALVTYNLDDYRDIPGLQVVKPTYRS